MKRSARIKALLSKSHEDSLALAAAYDASRGGQPLSDEIKVLIKNIFENLRSCLDYMAHEIFDKFCTGSRKPDKLYFPIRPSATEFTTAIAKSFPGLESTSKAVRDLLESVQPYRTKWLGQFNKLNNYNKHEDLSDHIQVDGQRITMRSGGGIISIGTAIGIAPDAKFFGVPVDPVTRLPVPNDIIETTVEPWSNFYFEDMESPLTVFASDCIRNIEEFFAALDLVA